MLKLAALVFVGLLVVAVRVDGQSSKKGACPCKDVQPEGEFQCEQQRKFGKCTEQFMTDGGFCDATCNKCPQECPYEPPELDLSCGCTDVPPEGGFTCDEQRRFGSCWEDWMLAGNYCAASCERCVCVNGVKCSNMPPPGNVLCLKQAEFGQCTKEWMLEKDFCALSCGRCPSESQIKAAQTQPKQKVVVAKSPQLPSIEAAAPAPQIIQENFDEIITTPTRSVLPNVVPATSIVPEPEDEVQEAVVAPKTVPESKDVVVEPKEDDQEIVANKLLDSLQNVRDTLDNITTPLTESAAECNSTIFETLSANPQLSMLTEMVEAAGLEATLSNPVTEFTVFAPNNKAMQKYAQNNPAYESYFEDESGVGFLQSISGYHIVNASYSSQQLMEVPYVETLLGKDIPLFVDVIRKVVNLEGVESSAKIVTPDIQVCKSSIHIIDNVLLATSELVGNTNLNLTTAQTSTPTSTAPKDDCVQKSILETLNDIPGASTFITALEAVEFDAFPSGPITIFVPQESAFQLTITQLGYKDLSDAVSTEEGQQILTSILMQHMIAGFFPSQKLGVGAPVTSLNGSLLLPEIVGKNLEIGAAGSTGVVIAEDVSETCDVAVHIVDTVLLPFESASDDATQVPFVPSEPTLAPSDFQDVNLQDCDTLGAVLSSRPELSLLSTTATTAGLDQVLNDPSQEISFFAPINKAFQGLTSLLGNSTEQIITNLEYLNAVLAYHAIDGVFTSQTLIPGQSYPTLVQDRQGVPLTVTIGEIGGDLVVIGEGSQAAIVESNIPACKSVVHLIDIVLLPVAQS